MHKIKTNEFVLMNTYNRFPLTLVKGNGSYVWDNNDEKYLDFTSGIAVCNLGHVPKAVHDAVKKQLENLWHCSNLYTIPSQVELATLLTENSCFDQAFFCNSGAEANEAAIKLARKYASDVAKTNTYEIVTFVNSFHGRTMATLSATGQEKVQKGFQPLVEGFTYLPYNDFAALTQLKHLKPCAVLLELVQGEGGVFPANPKWLKELVAICHSNKILIMIDEVQTGIGRTGTLFAYEQYGFEPDVITLAKGLGSGFPIGAILAKKEVAHAFEPGSHGSTFGGNPLATTAGVATIKYILNNNLLIYANELADYLKEKLHHLKEQFSMIEDIRGLGLLQGIVVKDKAIDIVNEARQQHVLLLTAGRDVVRILPPLTTTKQEIDELMTCLTTVFEKVG